MLVLSRILLQQHELSSFGELRELIKAHARAGEMFLEFDVRPPFEDTPADWEAQLEAAFTSAANTRG